MTTPKRQALLNRASEAIASLYHAATPSWPDLQNDYESDLFNEWLADQASFEIDHLNSGGGHGLTTADFVASKYKTLKAKGIAKRCYLNKVAIERNQWARYELVINYGQLYQYGRGGRTVMPDKLINTQMHHYSKPNEDYLEACNNAELTELIKCIEAFYTYTVSWNESIPSQWAEFKLENEMQADIDAHDGLTAKVVTKTIYV